MDGIDFVDHKNSGFVDVDGHGTHVAGIIGAIGNNDIGISGVNWNVSIMPLKALGQNGSFVSETLFVNSVEEAISSYDYSENPIRILNISMGIDEFPLDDFGEMLSYYPGLIVCAAGNDGSNIDYHPFYPAYYGSDKLEDPIENMIVVGAIDDNDNRSIWNSVQSSNYGVETVDIYAPGTNIYSTYLNNSYYEMSGTSMAAPYVSGVAALLLSINPNLTTSQLKDCILSGADLITITLPYGSTQVVKKLNAWGAFRYMLDNYIPSIILGENTAQVNVNTDKSSAYKIENSPMIKIGIPYDEEFIFEIAGIGSKVNATLYAPNISILETEQNWINNQLTINFTQELTKGTYYLMTSYDNTMGGNTLSVSVSHEHTADNYSYYNETLHIKSCACGACATETSYHVVAGPTFLQKFATCIYCGASIDISNDNYPSIMSVTKYSVNGSYVLSNSIIVLVDEDIEAYLNGTLVFYDKDSLPVVQ